MTLEERNKKVEENLPLVTFSLNKLGVAFDEDYFQQGVLELIRCVDRFDEKKGIKFSTYAVKNIKLFLKEYIARDKVLRPKRTGIKGRVYAPPCDSFEKVVYSNSKAEEITLEDMLADDFQIENNTIMLDISILVSKKLISENNTQETAQTQKEKKRGLGPLIDIINKRFNKEAFPEINNLLVAYIKSYLGRRKLPDEEKWNNMLDDLVAYSTIHLPGTEGGKFMYKTAIQIIEKAITGKDGAPFTEFDNPNIQKEPEFNLNQEFKSF